MNSLQIVRNVRVNYVRSHNINIVNNTRFVNGRPHKTNILTAITNTTNRLHRNNIVGSNQQLKIKPVVLGFNTSSTSDTSKRPVSGQLYPRGR